MSSFFTNPASQKKRKRADAVAPSSSKRRNTSDAREKATKSRRDREESISGSGSDITDDAVGAGAEATSESEGEHETAAERRLRLAERYLENVKQEVDLAGFDAADIDKDIIGARLKEDVAETKGKVYRNIASEYNWAQATHTFFKADQQAVTACGTHAPYLYTASKDLTVRKWEILDPSTRKAGDRSPLPTNIAPRKRPKLLSTFRGNHTRASDTSYVGPTASILCLACSGSGQYLATGHYDRKLIIWSTSPLRPVKVFSQHRDAVTGLSFRRGTHQLYSCSADRTIKLWSLDEMTYVETLFGHQDTVVDVDALSQECCVTVGARDRTARLWKVVEESQLVFRGGGSSNKWEKASKEQKEGEIINGAAVQKKSYAEHSIDRIALLDDETFVTGSDNGALSLWSIHKKKPVHIIPLAHGLQPAPPPEEASADKDPDPKGKGAEPTPRWITALRTLPYADIVLSGSWDGIVRVWKLSSDRRKLEAVGTLGLDESSLVNAEEDGNDDHEDPARGTTLRGVINDISIFERGDRGRDGLCVVIAVGDEHRLGRWIQVKAKNGGVVFEVKKKQKNAESDVDVDGIDGTEEAD